MFLFKTQAARLIPSIPGATDDAPGVFWDWLRGWHITLFIVGGMMTAIWFLLRMLGGKFVEEIEGLRKDLKATTAAVINLEKRLIMVEDLTDPLPRDVVSEQGLNKRLAAYLLRSEFDAAHAASRADRAGLRADIQTLDNQMMDVRLEMAKGK